MAEWENVGRIKGEDGKDGEKGEKGDKGDSIDYDWNGTELGIKNESESSYSYTDLKGEKGDKGDKGDTGAPMIIEGSVASEGDLPSQGQLGQAYIVDGDLYVWK